MRRFGSSSQVHISIAISARALRKTNRTHDCVCPIVLSTNGFSISSSNCSVTVLASVLSPVFVDLSVEDRLVAGILRGSQFAGFNQVRNV